LRETIEWYRKHLARFKVGAIRYEMEIPLSDIDLGKEEEQKVLRVCAQVAFYGPVTERFERAFSDYLGGDMQPPFEWNGCPSSSPGKPWHRGRR